jgi:hypothetical protein
LWLLTKLLQSASKSTTDSAVSLISSEPPTNTTTNPSATCYNTGSTTDNATKATDLFFVLVGWAVEFVDLEIVAVFEQSVALVALSVVEPVL